MCSTLLAVWPYFRSSSVARYRPRLFGFVRTSQAKGFHSLLWIEATARWMRMIAPPNDTSTKKDSTRMSRTTRTGSASFLGLSNTTSDPQTRKHSLSGMTGSIPGQYWSWLLELLDTPPSPPIGPVSSAQCSVFEKRLNMLP